jgi:hypothetical protein
MVAIVTGSGLGLFNSSRAVLGEQGSVGNATLGQGNESIYVNAATGNLVIQQSDEMLFGSGLDLNLMRSYNSQGLVDGDNNDNWQLSVASRLIALPPNVASGTITYLGKDGSQTLYTYNLQANAFISKDGDGAHDQILYSSEGKWERVDGTSRVVEVFNVTTGLCESTRDTDGNVTTYHYNGTLLTQIDVLTQDVSGSTAAWGQTIFLGYSGNNLAQIMTVSNGQIQINTRYYYDTSNRLSQVVVDLTPDMNVQTTDANNDTLLEGVNGQSYVTTYTYDGISKRVTSITQSDGTAVSFTYEHRCHYPGPDHYLSLR